jgi:hypothetical protein
MSTKKIVASYLILFLSLFCLITTLFGDIEEFHLKIGSIGLIILLAFLYILIMNLTICLYYDFNIPEIYCNKWKLIFFNILFLTLFSNFLYSHVLNSFILIFSNILIALSLIIFVDNKKQPDLPIFENYTVKKEFCILIVLFIIGYFFRIYGINKLGIYYDEFYHLDGINDFINSNPIIYTRGLYILTYPLSFIARYMNNGLFFLRQYPIILNLLAIIPLYLLLRKIGSLAGIIGVILYVSNPTMIARAQLLREYAIAPLLIFSIILLIWNIYIHLFQDPKSKGWSKSRLGLIFSSIGVISYILYVLLVDKDSTLKASIFIVIFLIFVIFSWRLVEGRFQGKYFIYIEYLIICSYTFFSMYAILNNNSNIPIDSTQKSVLNQGVISLFQYFDTRVPFHWDYKLIPSISLFFLGLVSMTTAKMPFTMIKRFFFFLVTTFWALFLSYFILLDTWKRFRYLFYLETLYVIVNTLGIIIFIDWIVNKFSITKKTDAHLIIGLCVLTLYINLLPVFTRLNEFYSNQTSYKFHPITQELYLPYANWMKAFNRFKFSGEDILISTSFGSYAKYIYPNKSSKIFILDTEDPDYIGSLETIIDKSKSGYYVVEYITMAHAESIPRSDYCFKSKQVNLREFSCIKYIGDFKGISIYHWDFSK